MIAILLCTDVTFVAIPGSFLSTGTTIEKRFTCRARDFLPVKCKGWDVTQENSDLVLSQVAYLDTKEKDECDLTSATKLKLYCKLTDEEISQHQSVVGRLARAATWTSPASACLASILPRRKRETVALLNTSRHAYAQMQLNRLSSLFHVPLDFDTVQIQVFSYGPFQNLPKSTHKSGLYSFLLTDTTVAIFSIGKVPVLHDDLHLLKKQSFLHLIPPCDVCAVYAKLLFRCSTKNSS